MISQDKYEGWCEDKQVNGGLMTFPDRETMAISPGTYLEHTFQMYESFIP